MNSKTFLLFALFSVILSCSAQNIQEKKEPILKKEDEIVEFQQKHQKDTDKSISVGTVNNGKLQNGCLLPYKGVNFSYFSKESYLAERAFIHCSLQSILIQSFSELNSKIPGHFFFLMEASNKVGGKISPHRTHQNGTSIDLMIPLIQNQKPYIGLDTIGIEHYLLKFTDKGEYSEDKTIQIDFETLALEILTIEEQARLNGWKISKVILKTELQPLLF